MARVNEIILWRDRRDPYIVLIGSAKLLPSPGLTAWASTPTDGIEALFGLDVKKALDEMKDDDTLLIEVRAEVVKE